MNIPKEVLDRLSGNIGYTIVLRKVKLVKYAVYPCSDCCKAVKVMNGNHHPWCSCGSDEFDWSEGVHNLTEAEANEVMKVWEYMH